MALSTMFPKIKVKKIFVTLTKEENIAVVETRVNLSKILKFVPINFRCLVSNFFQLKQGFRFIYILPFRPFFFRQYFVVHAQKNRPTNALRSRLKHFTRETANCFINDWTRIHHHIVNQQTYQKISLSFSKL